MDVKIKDRHIEVVSLEMRYGDRVIQKNLNFTIYRGEIFVIMGEGGAGKTTLLHKLVGLSPPSQGDVIVNGQSLWKGSFQQQLDIMRNFGVMFQSGALLSSMTLRENVSLPLREYTKLSKKQRRELALYKLALVGLQDFGDYYPAEISGGMCKRASIARAMALDPEVLFFDEPSAGLDPVSAHRLDELILHLRASLRATVVVVTHELPSIFSIADNAIFLDSESKTIIARGNPTDLLKNSSDPRVYRFLSRGDELTKKGV